MSKGWAGGSTSQWRRLRSQVIARDHGQCQLTEVGGPCMGGLTVHHRLGVEISGLICDPIMLTTACARHNRMVGQPQGDPVAERGNTQW